MFIPRTLICIQLIKTMWESKHDKKIQELLDVDTTAAMKPKNVKDSEPIFEKIDSTVFRNKFNAAKRKRSFGGADLVLFYLDFE